VQPMNIMAWLRKRGCGSTGLRFRNEFMNFGDFEGVKPVARAEDPEQRGFQLNGIAVSRKRAERCPGGLPGPWEDSGRAAAARVRQLVPGARHDETAECARSAPFVGREAELRVLLRAWRTAAGGRGRVALVRGEAGLGKSRLIRELCGRHAAHRHTKLWHRCSPEYAASPLYPLVSRLPQWAGFFRDDGPQNDVPSSPLG
jgi:AAA ATPase domain